MTYDETQQMVANFRRDATDWQKLDYNGLLEKAAIFQRTMEGEPTQDDLFMLAAVIDLANSTRGGAVW